MIGLNMGRNIDDVIAEEREKLDAYRKSLAEDKKSQKKSNFQPSFDIYQEWMPSSDVTNGMNPGTPEGKYQKFKNTMSKHSLADPDFGEAKGSGIPAGATRGYGTDLDLRNPIDTALSVFDGRGVDEKKKLGNKSKEQATFDDGRNASPAAQAAIAARELEQRRKEEKKAQAQADKIKKGMFEHKGDYYVPFFHGYIEREPKN